MRSAPKPKDSEPIGCCQCSLRLQSGSMENISNFIANAGKAVESGLSKDEALRALTLRSAEIFGVADRLGTIERGKIANLTITRGDLFNQNARITHVFIDGRPVDLKPAAANTPLTANTNATGSWSVKAKFDEGEQSATLMLQQQGERLSGSLQGDLGTAQIANSSVSGAGEIRFTAPVQLAGLTVEANFTGTFANNEMRGTIQIVGRQPATFTAVRSGGGARTIKYAANTTASQSIKGLSMRKIYIASLLLFALVFTAPLKGSAQEGRAATETLIRNATVLSISRGYSERD
ncbi:MAG: amidohydrolase family protein [Pyrinomonadaceae bacterium]